MVGFIGSLVLCVWGVSWLFGVEMGAGVHALGVNGGASGLSLFGVWVWRMSCILLRMALAVSWRVEISVAERGSFADSDSWCV